MKTLKQDMMRPRQEVSAFEKGDGDSNTEDEGAMGQAKKVVLLEKVDSGGKQWEEAALGIRSAHGVLPCLGI